MVIGQTSYLIPSKGIMFSSLVKHQILINKKLDQGETDDKP